jgi:hypothetical protein
MAIGSVEKQPHAMPARAAHERDLLQSSLALLEAGEARRVTIVGLRYGGLVAELRPEADAHGIRLRGHGRPGRPGRTDVVVEPIG